MAKESGGDVMMLLGIGAVIAGLVWLSNRNASAAALVPAGAATSGAALPPGATNAAGSTAGWTGSEVNPAMTAINTAAAYAAGGTGGTINTGSTA
jgi:hypothetical protein